MGLKGGEESEDVVGHPREVDRDSGGSVSRPFDVKVDFVDSPETCEGVVFCCWCSRLSSFVFSCSWSSNDLSLSCNASAARSVVAIIFEKAAIASSRCSWEIMMEELSKK